MEDGVDGSWCSWGDGAHGDVMHGTDGAHGTDGGHGKLMRMGELMHMGVLYAMGGWRTGGILLL